MHKKAHPFAGQVVRLKENIGRFIDRTQAGGVEFQVEDWGDRVLGGSVWNANGNPAAMEYAMRTALRGGIPIDDCAVYGKVDGYGHFVHDSEIERGE